MIQKEPEMTIPEICLRCYERPQSDCIYCHECLEAMSAELSDTLDAYQREQRKGKSLYALYGSLSQEPPEE